MPSKTKQDVITAIVSSKADYLSRRLTHLVAQANRIFDDMVSELQFDTILKARQDADKAKRPCRCCGTQLSCIDAQVAELLTLDCHTTSYPSYLLFLKVVLYVSDYDSSTETHRPMPVATAHTPGASASANSSTTRLSAIQQPASQNKSAISSSSGSGTPTKDGGNILLKCPICNRQVCIMLEVISIYTYSRLVCLQPRCRSSGHLYGNFHWVAKRCTNCQSKVSRLYSPISVY